MNKNLIIVHDSFDVKEFRRASPVPYDIFAFTTKAILFLDSQKISYKVATDFFNLDEIRRKLKESYSYIEILFGKLDDISESFCNFPYAYSGNLSYFVDLFSNLLYLEVLSEKLLKTYDKVYIFQNSNYKRTLDWSQLQYIDLKTNPLHAGMSLPLTNGLENKLRILYKLLNAQTITVDNECNKVIPSYSTSQKYLFKLIKSIRNGYVKRVIRKKYFNFKKTLHSILKKEKYKKIFIIQDGYEVENLKFFLNGFELSNPTTILRAKAPDILPEVYEFDACKETVRKYLEIYFPLSIDLIIDLIGVYHREVVGRIPFYYNSFKKMIFENAPKMMLFSVGTRDIYDCLFGYMANEKKVAVLYFQHGGSSAFYTNTNKRYVEYDPKIKKTLIRSSSVSDFELQNKNTDCRHWGNSLRYRLFKKNNRIKNNKRVLFSCNCPPYYTYKHVLNSASDIQCHTTSLDLITATSEKQIDLDIKLHPVEEYYSYFYFYEMIENLGVRNTRILYKTKGEEILDKYGLLVFDFLCSALFTQALILKVPIVLYLKDMSIVKKEIVNELDKRCYIVNDKKKLDEVLFRYLKGDLPRKWSRELIEKYICPIDKGHPLDNISKHIKSICEQ